jgi:prepilin-type N-terminal cleavage/methylation domain-containing protein
MRGMVRRLGGVGRDELGFTLPELLVATVLGLIVIGAATMAFTSAVRNQPALTSRANQIQQARTMMERITREIRQGSTVPTTPNASQLTLVTYVHSASCGGAAATTAIQCRVTYSCSAPPSGRCTRTERNPNGSGSAPPVTVVSGISSNSVFGYQPSVTAPTYVSVTLAFRSSSGANAVTLTDGAAFRNPSAG